MESVDVTKKPLGYKNISANTVIINEGVSDNIKMYIILSGSAKVYKNYKKPGQITISELTQGDFFGEMSLFLNKEPTVSIVASSDMTALEITKEKAQSFFANSPSATYRIMQVLCKRIDDLNTAYGTTFSQQFPEHSEAVEENEVQHVEPAEQIPVPAHSEINSLEFFPAGHTGYVLPDEENDPGILLVKNFDCPICRGTFMFPVIRQYKLRKISTDFDMRMLYKGVNLTHYYVTNCPECLFSAVSSVFEKVVTKKTAEILNKGKELKMLVNISSNAMDADSIFARLYLALEFMPLAYYDSKAHIAQLWLNISWLYRDCGDASMENFAIERALAAHLKVYSEVNLDSKRLQRICMIIAELYYKTGDLTNARKFFFEAKTIKDGFTDLSDMADDRLEKLKKEM